MRKTFQRTVKHIARRRINLLSAPLAYPAGHFYSPITDTRTLAKLYRDPGSTPAPLDLPGIALDREKMIALWDRWSTWLDSPRPGTSEGCRYNPANGQFGPGDALVLSFMLRHARPQRLIEIGSGYSSAVSLDTIEQYLDHAVECTFIDPHPQRLLNLFRDGERQRHRVIVDGIQYVDPAIVDSLEANDILFIDSTHIVKTCSDVVQDLFALLPRLKSGVYVHFHDMFWPFEYPKAWVMDTNLSWNELYTIRAFLMYNSEFEITFFGDYMWQTARETITQSAPDMANLGGNLWLRKV